MINYPSDKDVLAQARALDIPAPVLIRDIVRIVEILNLREKGFFGARSVLAGSMALRSYGSPRFTVYDADFSTTSEQVEPPTAMKDLLAYEDDELTITPEPLTPQDGAGTVWKSSPVLFDPVFSALVPSAEDRSFKADVSFRGLVLDGREQKIKVPYELALWHEEPTVHVMDLHETVAEKTLGWCAHRLVKHYADLGYITLVAPALRLDYARARSVLADKLDAMRAVQPDLYAAFSGVEDLIDDLASSPQINARQWDDLIYISSARGALSLQKIETLVRGTLATQLRRPARR